MRVTFYCLLVLFFLIILSLDGVSTRHLHPNDAFALYNQGANIQNPQPSEITHDHTSEQDELMKKKRMGLLEEKAEKMREIGSRVPRCEDKCYGCTPCEPIQVPTTVNGGVGIQYTNYEPEAWKCKCGPSFYAP